MTPVLSPGEHHQRNRVRGRAVAIAAGVALIVSVTTACSSSGSASSSSGNSAGSSSSPGGSSNGSSTSADAASGAAELAKAVQSVTSYPAVAPTPGGASALKGKTVWFVPISASLTYMQSIGRGIGDALAAAGAKLHICDGKLLPTAMASCMDDAAQQHAGAVIAGFIDYKLIPNAYDNLVADNIPVLIGGAAADGGKTTSPKLAFFDLLDTQTTTQRLIAEKVIADSSGAAKILYIGSKDTPELANVAAYGKAYYQDHCPKCTFTEIDYLTSAASKLGSQVNAALISHPDTTYVVLEFDPFAGPVASAIQTAGKTSNIKLVSTGGGLDSLQRVGAGRSQFVDAGSSGFYTGWLFTDGVARMLTGKTPVVTQAVTRIFTSDNVKSLSLTSDAYLSNAWYGNDNYKAIFTKAWGL